MGNVVFLCVLLVGLSYAGAAVYGLNGWEKAIVFLAFALWTAGLMASSFVVAVKQLEHVKMRKIIDGEEKVFVTLKLGPFGYTIEVPEEKPKDK